MRYVIERGWQYINEGSGIAQNVSPTAEIEVSNSSDNGGLIIFPGQKFPFTQAFYARKHRGGGPCVLAILDGNGSVPVPGGGGSGSSSGSSGDSGLSNEDIDCLFPTHHEYTQGGGS